MSTTKPPYTKPPIYNPEFNEVLKDKILNAKTAEVEIETPAESQPATGSSGSENDASKSEDSRKGFRKRNITAYENKLRYNHVSTVLTVKDINSGIPYESKNRDIVALDGLTVASSFFCIIDASYFGVNN